MTQEGDDPFALAQRYNNHLTRLRNSDKDDLPVQTVPAHASLEDAIDIFDRVNSQGTKLTDADLALTHMTGKWAQARRVLKIKIDQLANTFANSVRGLPESNSPNGVYADIAIVIKIRSGNPGRNINCSLAASRKARPLVKHYEIGAGID